MRWSENETYQFVKLYLKRDFLWNTEDISYRDKVKRLTAYKEIIAELNERTGILMTIPEVKTKVKNLRSTYCQELAKIKNRSNPEWTYRPNMKWFALWDEKFSSIKRISERSSFDDQQDSTDEGCQKMWVTVGDDDDEETMEEETLDPFPEQEDEYSVILKTEPQEVVHINKETRYPSKKKKIKHQRSSTESSDRTFRESIDSIKESTSQEDEFDIYGKYIASQLRQMGLQKALRVQLEIQSLVSEARISDLNEKQ